jgi:hypothetical protein
MKRLTLSDGTSKDRDASVGRAFYLCTLLPNEREDVTLTALFPPDCSGSLTVASKTRLRCSDALASARHRPELLLARMRAKVDNLCNRRAKLRAIAQGNNTRKAIDCAVPHAPPVHMIELLQEREITLVGYSEEYDKSLER